MKMRLFFVLVLSFVTAISAAAQNRTVTNADLEKFRQKRLQAEREYRENYQRLGFPSPDELDRQRIESNRERAELSARIERENLAREQAERDNRLYQAQINAYNAAQYNSGAYYNNGGNYNNGYYPFANYGGYYPSFYNQNGYYNNRRRNRGFNYGSFYGPTGPGAFGVRINNNGVRINNTPNDFRVPPQRIRPPR